MNKTVSQKGKYKTMRDVHITENVKMNFGWFLLPWRVFCSLSHRPCLFCFEDEHTKPQSTDREYNSVSQGQRGIRHWRCLPTSCLLLLNSTFALFFVFFGTEYPSCSLPLWERVLLSPYCWKARVVSIPHVPSCF